MSSVVTDDNGIPVPQYFNDPLGIFQTMKGTEGAIYTIDKNYPVDGVNLVKIIGKDNKIVPITESGVPVILADASVNCMYHNGTRWLAANRSCNMSILTKNSYSAATNISSRVYNNGCKDAILTIVMDTSATNSIKRVDIAIVDAAGNSSAYKSITLADPITTGTVSIPFGINEANAKFIVPSEFTVNFIHTSAAIALSYSANLQLV